MSARMSVHKDMIALLRDPKFTMSGGSEFAAQIVAALGSEADAELDQLRLEVWRQGSRFNVMVLENPPMPPREFYANNAEFLKACGDAADAFMAASVVQGSQREVA